jgi:hypothetical protein
MAPKPPKAVAGKCPNQDGQDERICRIGKYPDEELSCPRRIVRIEGPAGDEKKEARRSEHHKPPQKKCCNSSSHPGIIP